LCQPKSDGILGNEVAPRRRLADQRFDILQLANVHLPIAATTAPTVAPDVELEAGFSILL
jgi:hypothetical protein